MKRAVKALIDSRILGRALLVGVVLEVGLMVACKSTMQCSAS
jgi:hypothetical protein